MFNIVIAQEQTSQLQVIKNPQLWLIYRIMMVRNANING